ncbi:MAG TPA: hypothetical protein VMM58_07585 [Bacteroidota bacterium]|nr:hypothetical protein [Bacteroidota bacterium]
MLRSAGTFLCLLTLTLGTRAQENSYRFALDSADERIVISIETAEPLPCVGSSIRNQVLWENDTVTVILSGFVRPSPCLEGFDPARVKVVAGRTTMNKFYLRFRENDQDDLWKISKETDGFQASPIRSFFTSYKN